MGIDFGDRKKWQYTREKRERKDTQIIQKILRKTKSKMRMEADGENAENDSALHKPPTRGRQKREKLPAQ